MAKKKLNTDTLKNLKTMSIVYIVLLLLGVLICIGVAVPIAEKSAIAALIIGLGGGAGCSYGAYAIAVNPKNQKTCNVNWFNVTENVLNPTGSDADTDLDITDCLAQKNAEYNGYAGVWLKSNVNAKATLGNFDAFYIPFGDDPEKTTITLTPSTGPLKGTAYTKKGSKDDKGVTISMKSPVPSSP